MANFKIKLSGMLVVLMLLGIISPLLSLADNAETPAKLVIGGDYNYPPYEFIDKDGKPAGYNVDLTRAIAEVMGIEVVIELGDWDTMRSKLDNGEVDALQGMSYSEERTKIVDFTPPHALIHQSVFARHDGSDFKVLDDLTDKEVIVQNSGIMHDKLLESHVKARLILVDTHVDALRLLASGKHDFAVVANLPSLYLSRELGLSNIVPVGTAFGTQRYGFAVKKGNQEVLAKLSEGQAILKNTGKQQEIYDHWLGALESTSYPWNQLVAIAFILGVLTLITAVVIFWNRMLKKQVNRRTQALELKQKQLIQADKMASLGVLVSGVAHEINNPVSLMLMNLPMLKEAYQDSESILEAHYQKQGDFIIGGLPYSRMKKELPKIIEDMESGSVRIKRIVDDLRDFARTGGSDMYQQCDLNDIVKAVVRILDSTIRNATDHFTLQLDSHLPAFQGNVQKVEQVVINLLVNACQALENKQQGIEVQTAYDQGNKQLYLYVRDQGKGIHSDQIHRLKEPFFTTKRESGGTGLGLSISHTIIKEHNGDLSFESQMGKGTCAMLSLPAMQEAD